MNREELSNGNMMISTLMVGFVKRKVLAVQDFSLLLVSSLRRAFTPPRYVIDTLLQMDIIGVGSLPIVLLTGLFTGGVLALQSYRTLSTFGEVGIASELGSMLVSEQIDAMRAFGTDPIRKLVLPRLFATLTTLPLLTILADFAGMLGGFFISFYTVHLTSREYWNSVSQSLTYQDVTQGMVKPFVFAVVIAMVG